MAIGVLLLVVGSYHSGKDRAAVVAKRGITLDQLLYFEWKDDERRISDSAR
jgi:hypothetical protein